MLFFIKFGVRWFDDKKNYKIVLDKANLKQALSKLIGNCQMIVGTAILGQVTGLHLSSDPTPFIANLFLCQFENK